MQHFRLHYIQFFDEAATSIIFFHVFFLRSSLRRIPWETIPCPLLSRWGWIGWQAGRVNLSNARIDNTGVSLLVPIHRHHEWPQNDLGNEGDAKTVEKNQLLPVP